MKKETLITIIVVVVIILIAIIVIMGNHGAPAEQATQTANVPVQQSTSTPPAAAYASAADGFSVNLPGTPDIASKTFKSPTVGSISETDYTFVSSANGKGILYMIMALHYSASYQFTSSYLKGALQMFGTIINAKYPGTKVTAEPQSQFLGGTAISASVIVPFMGTPTPGNVLITTKGHNAYIVSAYGLSQNDYTTFLNSFAFTQ